MNILDATAAVLERAPEALYVAALGTPTAALRVASGDGPHLYMGGAMGSAVALALGVAECVAPRRVIALVGDGEMVMSARSLWSVAGVRPANLLIVVMADARYAMTGGQAIETAVAFAGPAAALPGLAAARAGSAGELVAVLERMALPGLVEVALDESVTPSASPFVDPQRVRLAFEAEAARGAGPESSVGRSAHVSTRDRHMCRSPVGACTHRSTMDILRTEHDTLAATATDREGERMAKEIKAIFGVDIDAVGGWLGSYGGEDSPSDIQRGMFAGDVGTPRLLRLFVKHGIPATWFIPGHSIETFPDSVRMIVEAGHEIGAHGYSHENPIAMTPKQEEDVLVRCVELIERSRGGGRAATSRRGGRCRTSRPSCCSSTASPTTTARGIDDFTPFYARVGDSWTKIDYSQERGDVDEAARARAGRSTSSRSGPTGTWTTCRR